MAGLITAVFVGWRLGRRTATRAADFGISAYGIVWIWLLRFGVPLMIIVILIRSAGFL
jgi:SNF family Na+-dependent transporter